MFVRRHCNRIIGLLRRLQNDGRLLCMALSNKLDGDSLSNGMMVQDREEFIGDFHRMSVDFANHIAQCNGAGSVFSQAL
jgi:hypothetical protein